MDPTQLPAGAGLSQLPAGLPPKGILSNFTSPSTLKTPIVTVNVAFLAIATLLVCLRLYTRKFINRLLGPEDYVCALALLGSGAHSGLLFYLVDHELGKHVWDIQAIKLTPDLAHLFNALGFTYVLVIFLVKSSVLLLFYNLFGANKTMRYLIFLGIAFAAITCVAFTGYNITALATCDNVAALSNPVCVNTWIVTIVTGSTNTMVDAYILVLPIAMVLRLQLSRQRKFGVIVIFAIGLLAVIASLVRLVLNIDRGKSHDVFWDAALTTICSCIEMNVGILCASVPAIPMFFRQHKLGLGALSSLRYRIFGKTSAEALQTKKDQKGKSFRGIELNMTSPSLGMKSKLGVKSEEYTELDEDYRRDW